MPRNGRPYLLSEAEREQVRAWSVAGVPMEEQARRLGRPASNLIMFRRSLARQGLITIPKRSATHRPWTADDLLQLRLLIDEGFGYAAIAERLSRTENAIFMKTKDIGYKLLHSREALTCKEIADLLGLACPKRVTRWITTYGLRARNAQAGTNKPTIWRVQWGDLLDWLEDERHWMAYDPATITDPQLRERLTRLRAGRPGWLRPGEVARRYHVGADAVKQWIVKGFIPATRYGNWWVRESDLAGFVPPCERDRTGIPKASRRLVVGPDRIIAGPPARKAA
jgi:DNA-binding transcriptional MerR regulator